MKSARNSEQLRAFVRRALRESKRAQVEPLPPLRAIVRGVLAADVGDARADEAMTVIDREFVDLNELRVATELEIQDMLGVRYPDIERRAVQIVAILNGIFDREGTLSLDRVAAQPKKEIRQFLRQLPEMTPFVEAYTMLHAFEHPAVPVDDALLSELREEQAVDASATAEDLQSLLEAMLKAEEAADFHLGARKLLTSKSRK